MKSYRFNACHSKTREINMDADKIRAGLIGLGKSELLQIVDDAADVEDLADFVVELYTDKELDEILAS